MSTTRSFRLENDLDERLQELARKQRISVNQLVTRNLRKLIEWDSALPVGGLAVVTPELLVRLLEKQSVAESKELGEWVGRSFWLPYVKVMLVSVNLPNLLEVLRRLSLYGGRFSFDHIVEGRSHRIDLKHSMGLRWSAFYAGALKVAFEEGLNIELQLKVSKDDCVARFVE